MGRRPAVAAAAARRPRRAGVFVAGAVVNLGQANRRRRQIVGDRVADRLRRRAALDAELGEVDVVDRRDALLGTAQRRVAGGAAVDLAARRVGVTRPDELVDHDRRRQAGQRDA